MANQQHLAIIKQGARVWNDWVRDNPELPAELAHAVLSDVNLREAHLTQADLTEANLMEASLEGADLRAANLHRANLSFAKLSDAQLSFANLTDADLTQAHLSDANLNDADLSRALLLGTDLCYANLSGANLKHAWLAETAFGNTDLTGASGLDACQHLGPSTLDFRTLQRSGTLPVPFLRGCGLPDALIDTLPSLLTPPTYHSCFISYSTKDQEFADQLYADLQKSDVRCWYAPHHIQAGKKIHEQIRKAIGEQDRLLLVLSEHSMAAEWVKTEIAEARQREATQGARMLFPIRLVDFERIKQWECFDADTGKDSAREIREYFIPDFQHWRKPTAYGQAFDRLLHDLRVNPPSP